MKKYRILILSSLGILLATTSSYGEETSHPNPMPSQQNLSRDNPNALTQNILIAAAANSILAPEEDATEGTNIGDDNKTSNNETAISPSGEATNSEATNSEAANPLPNVESTPNTTDDNLTDDNLTDDNLTDDSLTDDSLIDRADNFEDLGALFSLDQDPDEEDLTSSSNLDLSFTATISPQAVFNFQSENLVIDDDPINTNYWLFVASPNFAMNIGYQVSENWYAYGSISSLITNQIYYDSSTTLPDGIGEIFDQIYTGAGGITGLFASDIYILPQIRLQPQISVRANHPFEEVDRGTQIVLNAIAPITNSPSSIDTTWSINPGLSAGLSLLDGKINVALIGDYSYTWIDRPAIGLRGQLLDGLDGTRNDHSLQFGGAGYYEHYFGTTRYIIGIYGGYRLWLSNYELGNNAGYDLVIRNRFQFDLDWSLDTTASLLFLRFYHRYDAWRINTIASTSLSWTALSWMTVGIGPSLSYIYVKNSAPTGEYTTNPTTNEKFVSTLGLFSATINLSFTFTWGAYAAKEKISWISDTAKASPSGGANVGTGGACIGGVCTF